MISKALRISFLFIFAALTNGVFAQSFESIIQQMDREDYSGAKRTAKALIAQNPKAQEPYFYLGEVYYATNKMDSAKYYYNQGVELAKGGLNYVGLSKIALDEKNTVELEKNQKVADKAAKGKDFRVYYELGKAFLESKNQNLDKAIEWMEKARGINNAYADTHVYLGDAYAAKGDQGKAVSRYEEASKINKQDPKPPYKRGVIWKNAKIYDQAESSFNECLKIDSNFAPALKELTDVYYFKGQYSKIPALLEKYTSIVGTDIEAQERLARYLAFQAREYDKAIASAEKVLAKDGNSYSMYRVLAGCYFEQKSPDYQKAFDSATKLFEKIGDNKVYDIDYNYYIKSAIKLGKFDEAAKKAEEFAAKFPDSKNDYLSELAAAYIEKKDYARAIPIFKKKCENSASKTITQDLYYLGTSLFNTSDYTSADAAFAKLNELSPTYVQGFSWRARCLSKLDPDLAQGLAKPIHEKIIAVASADPKKYADALFEANRYLAYYEISKDNLEGAKAFVSKAYEIKPSNGEIVELMGKLGMATTTTGN